MGVTRSLRGQRGDGSVFPLDISLGFFPFKTPTSEKLFVATLRETNPLSSVESSSETSSEERERERGRQAIKMNDMIRLLQQHDLDEYSQLFRDEEVDLQSFYMMSEDDLKAMGVKMGPRRKLLSIIKEHELLPPQSPHPDSPFRTPAPKREDDRVTRHSSSSSSSSSTSFNIDPAEIIFLDIIGRGSFGVVHKFVF